MIRIDYEDPDRTDGDWDVNGRLICLYKGEPFTGIVEHYEAGILVGAYEFENGHKWGLQRDFIF